MAPGGTLGATLLLVTAVAAARAQDVRSRPVAGDSTRADTSGAPRRTLTAADTIKVGLPASYRPLAVGAREEPMHWDRAALFAKGALTLAELLAEIPGVTLMATGFLLAPAVPAWHGDPGGVRLFVDGVERDELTPRNGGVADLSLMPLWALEDVSVEETATELRVHVRTWRVDRTTASTRTDVLTGSDNLNLFRGYFGKRASNGLALQVAAQQASTVEPLTRLDGDALGAFGRLGWAGGRWGVDATWLRQGLNRNAGARYLLTTPVPGALPAYHGSTSLAYLRLAWGSPDSAGAWVQMIASSQAAVLTPPSNTASPPATPVADTTASQSEYTTMAGWSRAGLSLAAGGRLRVRDGTSQLAPLVRLDARRSWGAVAFSGERRMGGATTWDVRARAEPLGWLRVSGSAGVSQPSGWQVDTGAATPGVSQMTATRTGSSLDASVGFRGRWIGAGLVHQGMATVLAPVELDTAMSAVTVPAVSGLKVTIDAPLARGWNIRTDVVNWGAASAFRPRTEVHTRLWFESHFLSFAPRGNFQVVAALTHDYRTVFSTPSVASAVGQSTPGYGVYGALVHIRVSTATLYWDFRNMTGHPYETFPGYLMPRNLSVYGIRWDFWG